MTAVREPLTASPPLLFESPGRNNRLANIIRVNKIEEMINSCIHSTEKRNYTTTTTQTKLSVKNNLKQSHELRRNKVN